jgi:hypothetical protein
VFKNISPFAFIPVFLASCLILAPSRAGAATHADCTWEIEYHSWYDGGSSSGLDFNVDVVGGVPTGTLSFGQTWYGYKGEQYGNGFVSERIIKVVFNRSADSALILAYGEHSEPNGKFQGDRWHGFALVDARQTGVGCYWTPRSKSAILFPILEILCSGPLNGSGGTDEEGWSSTGVLNVS